MKHIILAALLLLASPAAAQMICGSLGSVMQQLLLGYGEVPAAGGVGNNGSFFQLMVGEETWTILMILPNSRACVIASGDNWEQVLAQPKGPET